MKCRCSIVTIGLRILAGLVACAGAVVIVAWIIGRIWTDTSTWTQWLWWIPTPATSAAALLSAVAVRLGFAKTKRRTILCGVFACGLLFGAVWFSFVDHRLFASVDPHTTSRASLRIVHWNISSPLRGEEDDFVAGFDALEGDVFLLTSPSGTARLSKRVREEGWFEQRLNIFSIVTRKPIIGSRVLVSDASIRIVLIEVDTIEQLGRTLIVYAVDLPSELDRPRMEVARQVHEMLVYADGPPADVIVGDCNIPRGSASLEVAFPGYLHAYDIAGHGYGATFRRDLPLYHIDHIFVLQQGDLIVERYDILRPTLGRHLIQAATIRRSAEEPTP
ncbi:MAG: hypothetical protein ACR2GY_11080 [Phycisphaerales bacterium]